MSEERETIVQELLNAESNLKYYINETDKYWKRLNMLRVKAKSYLSMLSNLLDLNLPWDDMGDTWDRLIEMFGQSGYRGGGEYDSIMQNMSTAREGLDSAEQRVREAKEKLRKLEE